MNEVVFTTTSVATTVNVLLPSAIGFSVFPSVNDHVLSAAGVTEYGCVAFKESVIVTDSSPLVSLAVPLISNAAFVIEATVDVSAMLGLDISTSNVFSALADTFPPLSTAYAYILYSPSSSPLPVAPFTLKAWVAFQLVVPVGFVHPALVHVVSASVFSVGSAGAVAEDASTFYHTELIPFVSEDVPFIRKFVSLTALVPVSFPVGFVIAASGAVSS